MLNAGAALWEIQSRGQHDAIEPRCSSMCLQVHTLGKAASKLQGAENEERGKRILKSSCQSNKYSGYSS